MADITTSTALLDLRGVRKTYGAQVALEHVVDDRHHGPGMEGRGIDLAHALDAHLDDARNPERDTDADDQVVRDMRPAAVDAEVRADVVGRHQFWCARAGQQVAARIAGMARAGPALAIRRKYRM